MSSTKSSNHQKAVLAPAAKKQSNITFHIISAKFKENVEEGGKDMDPYVKLKIGSQEWKTDVQYNAN